MHKLRKTTGKRLVIIIDVGIGAENINDPVVEVALEMDIPLKYTP